ncbi:MAG: phosphoribosylglycinamide formyltransferase [Chloroflexi bacterium]|nr:phosphoribosylglycinamide formyltransferase [Chloroflexota bacterium]
MSKPHLVILLSGSGSNLQAILDAVDEGRVTAVPTLVVSNRKAAYGLVRAKNANIPTVYHPFKPYRDAGKTRDEYEADLAKKIKPYQPDLIVLAGWLHILGADFLHQFPNQVINLHPALPGSFPGTHAIERAFEAYQQGSITHSGCMIHYTVPEVDAGKVIVQTVVPIHPEDTLDSFEARMHQAEHRIMVEAIHQLMTQA